MSKLARNNKGFTLIEMLLVMSVIMVISTLSFYSFQSYYDKKKLDYFMEQLEEDILFAQMTAMASQRVVYVNFGNEYYTVKDQNIFAKELLKRYYGEGIAVTFLTSSMSKQVVFYPNGNIKKIGKVQVKYKKYKYTIVFQLGRGRFYYE